MATEGSIGYGQSLGYSNDGAAYTSVAQTTDFDGPDVSVKAVQITNNDSPNGFHEKTPGMGDAGKVTFKCIYKKTIVSALYGLIRATKYWKLTYPDGSTWVCQGFITMGPKVGSPMEDAEIVDVTLEWSGKPVFTAAA